jgi:trimeric autotransporter adhesin
MRLGRAVKGLLPEMKGLRLAMKALLLGMVIALLAAAPAWATEFHGQVVFGGLPVPGAQATVTATQGAKTVTAITDDQGLFGFADLTDGAWTITITMTGFAPIKEPITVAPNSPIPVFELKLQTLAQIREEDKPVKVEPGAAPAVATATTSPTADTTASSAKGKAPADTKGKPAAGNQTAANAPPEAPQPAAQEASSAPSPDGFLINGSVNNAATSQFSLNQAFGNARNSRSLYNAQFALNFSSSTLNANSYSLLGPAAKPNFNNYTAQLQFGGPLKIPHLIPLYRAPNFYVAYGRSDNTSVAITPGLVPMAGTVDPVTGDYDIATLAAITGETAYVPTSGISPACLTAAGGTAGSPFPKNGNGDQYIPGSCISPIAQNVLTRLYPTVPAKTPVVSGYNYQVPLSTDSHSDFGRVNLSKGLGNKNNVNGNYSLQSTRESSPNLFGFVDRQKNLGQSVNASWYHRYTQRLSASTSYSFSRQRSDTTIFFQNKNENVSNEVGINGNLQDAPNYGPPGLRFSQSQFSGVSDGTSRNNRNQTQNISVNANWNRFRHEMQFGGDFRRQEWNYFQQSNPRGSITFDGTATQTTDSKGNPIGGMDFADFLLGLPDTSQIAYGNADKYLRESLYDFFVKDDFRVSPEFTVNFGVRYEYSGPVTETKNRLVNLDFAPNFAQQATVLATSPTGSLSNQGYPRSLLRPDRAGFAPTVAIAWRPISGSSLLVRSSYGLYHDSSVYQQVAYAMATQTPGLGAPWSSISENISGTSSCPLALNNPFAPPACATTTSAADTFAVDPNFRVGYLHAWNLSLQRDLPAALQLYVVYNGSKGLRGVQEILPNTYPEPAVIPVTAADPCPSCPKGFAYRMSNGNSTYESGQVQLRRRLRAGLQATATYTYSKSLDDDYSYGGSGPVFGSSSSGGSSAVAQDWRHPEAQRGLSTFDQRHKLQLTAQYTTGMGLGGHPLMSGWRGAIYKEWTVLTNISVGSGLPETIVDPIAVPGTTYTGIIRADYNGKPIYQPNTGASPLAHLNQGAFTGPVGHFGTSGRDFIIGPSQFSMNGSMQRTFRLHDRISMDARIDANNVLNHVVFSSWNSILPSSNSSGNANANSQFGTPTSPSGMRSVSINLRVRY